MNFNQFRSLDYWNDVFQHNLAFSNMIPAFSSSSVKTEPSSDLVDKTEPSSDLVDKTAPSSDLVDKTAPIHHPDLSCSISLDSEIPREEIEGDIEVIMVRNFQENLKTLNTTLNGLRGKKYGFREVLEMCHNRPTYAIANLPSKRKRSDSFGSMEFANNRCTIKDHSLKEEKKVKVDVDNSLLDDSSCSDNDDNLVIDLGSTAIQEEKNEQLIEAEKGKTGANIIGEKNENKTKNEVEYNLKTEAEVEYKSSMLRFERLKNIQKRKPRFNVDKLDLTYHSNMARNFPGTENRTLEQKERREKNTLAARISRNKNKAYEKLLEQSSIDATVENINLKRHIACLRVYANSLMKIAGYSDTDFNKMWEINAKEMLFNKAEY